MSNLLDHDNMVKAMQAACDDQVRLLNEAAKLTCEYEATAAGGENE